jgi:hypothetical protein
LSLHALSRAFEKADAVTLSKFEFTAITESLEPIMATGSELSMAKMEIRRIRKLAIHLWKASERVSQSMQRCSCTANEKKIRESKFYLDQSRVVYWQDLPQRLRHRWREFTGLG